jgi:hypothetical protein
LGFTLRSVPLSKGIRPLPSGWTHLPFLLQVCLSPKRKAGPADRGSWASTLPRVLGERGHIECVDRWMLPWVFSLLGFAGKRLDRDFARSPPTRLATRAGTRSRRLRPGVSRLLPGPTRFLARKRTKPSKTTLLGFSHRHSPATFEPAPHSGYGFTSRCVVHRC